MISLNKRMEDLLLSAEVTVLEREHMLGIGLVIIKQVGTF
jgi:hypothetical protein